MAFRYDVVLKNANGLPADRYMNVLHFAGTSGEATAVESLAVPALTAFFNTVAVGGDVPLAAFLGQQCDRSPGGSSFTWYDETEAEPRTPHPVPWQLGPADTGTAGGTPLPAEVACVASLTSDHAGGRGRGRMYLGPFNTSAVNAGNESGESRPAISMRLAIRGSVQRLADTMHLGGHDWVIWSRMNAAYYPITHGFIDNAWDTQRRRGLDPTSRLTWLRGI